MALKRYRLVDRFTIITEQHFLLTCYGFFNQIILIYNNPFMQVIGQINKDTLFHRSECVE